MAIGTSTDAILTSVIGNRLDAVSREIGQTMLRTSRSPIFSEARDFVTAIFDRDLRLVAQTAYIPVLMGSTPYAMRAVAERFAGNVDEGDVFVLNDPYRGNNHPPDITVLKPVFWRGEIAFWCVAKGHHADVGGGGVAGYNPGARSVWEECIRIPPAKLYVRGEANEALWDTILINVHIPFLVEGDLHCQVGACNIGERSLHKLLAKYGRDTLDGAIGSLYDASETQMRGAIRSVPAGRYSAERHIDHDGLGTRMIAVRVAIEVAEDALTFDFSESDPQCAGYVNSTIANTASSCYLALFTSIGSGIRINEGVLRALEIVAPPGTIVNALEPAPVTGCTISASQAIIEACWLALAQAVPERVDAAWGRWCAPATMGINPRTGAPFGDIHFLCKGGAGASKGIDGWDHLGTVVCAGGLRSPDPELHELADPYTVLQYEFWPDSAGAGEWRGGLGTMYRFRVDAPGIGAANFGGGNRPETAPFGLEGGLAAPPHELRLHKASGETIEVDAEAFYDLGEGDVYEILQSGGGGYGDPHNRPAEAVARDVRDGVVSAEAARELYGR